MKNVGITNTARGFTIIELLVAMTVFLIVVGITSGIFIRTIRTQRIITDMSASLNNITLALEQIAREARTGYMFRSLTDSELEFTNAQGELVKYLLDEDQIQRSVNSGSLSSITSGGTIIERLEFEIKDNSDPAFITIAVKTVGEGNIEVNLQTSVSSRVIGL
ncbi:MAG: prepilin-type N-terminal cleavage/methylation domain-containing protein [Candidatus Colwellbacteria bacterium]|nr:prepilin-type N-terminal cleavage/methylation domain-containing protein [Candidatus Colwellbacteria bacterium]